MSFNPSQTQSIKSNLARIVWRIVRAPFSPGGRNFLLWQVLYHSRFLLFTIARLYRVTLARRMSVVMVVGTFGKTTTTRAILQALGQRPDHWSERNANNQGSVAWSLLRHPPWRSHVVIEAGILGPNTMAPYARCLRPNIVVVTCVGSEHLQSFTGIEQLRSEKAEAVRALETNGIAVLNRDDPHVQWMAHETRARIVWYGYHHESDVQGVSWSNDWPDGGKLEFTCYGQAHHVASQLTGRHSSYALLAAVAVAQVENRSMAEASTDLTALSPTPGRMQRRLTADKVWLLRDDFKSTWETVHAALDALVGIPGRITIVLGGIDSPPKPQRPAYRRVAARAAELADEIVLVGPTGPFYSAELERHRIGGARLQTVQAFRQVSDASDYLKSRLQPGDVVFIKGRKSERLARLALALEGREVRCNVEGCRLHFQNCDDCALLGKRSPSTGIRLDDRIVGQIESNTLAGRGDPATKVFGESTDTRA